MSLPYFASKLGARSEITKGIREYLTLRAPEEAALTPRGKVRPTLRRERGPLRRVDHRPVNRPSIFLRGCTGICSAGPNQSRVRHTPRSVTRTQSREEPMQVLVTSLGAV